MKFVMQKVYNVIKRILVEISLKFPLKNRVIAESFLGKRHDDNISLYLADIDETKTPIYYVQRYDNKSLIPKGKRLVKNSFAYIWYMHTSNVIITNSRLHSGVLKKRTGQKIIQFWHGIPWKKLVHDQDEINFSQQKKEVYLKAFASDVAKWDYLWVPNKYAKEKLQSAFQYCGQYIEKMYPADKKMLALHDDADALQMIKQKLKIAAEKKVILYMPTFREHLMSASGRYQYYSNINLEAFAAQYPEFIILLRTHYLIAEDVIATCENIIDVSDYESVNDLYLVSDILITDYSSAIYSFALLQKPIVSLQFDLAEYEQTRGLYADGISDMNIIKVRNLGEFERLDWRHELPKSKPKEGYY